VRSKQSRLGRNRTHEVSLHSRDTDRDRDLAIRGPVTITRRCDPLPFPLSRRTRKPCVVRAGIRVPRRAGLRLRDRRRFSDNSDSGPTYSPVLRFRLISRHEARFCANSFFFRTLTSNYLCLEELAQNGAVNPLFSGGGEGVPPVLSFGALDVSATRGSTLLVRMEEVVLRLHMAHAEAHICLPLANVGLLPSHILRHRHCVRSGELNPSN
jgi:hypothetical protein